MTLDQIKKHFEIAKTGFVITVQTNIETAKRIDNLLSVRDLAYKFYGATLDNNGMVPAERIEMFKELQNISVQAYEDVLKVAEKFDFETFAQKEMDDLFKDIVPKTNDVETEQDLLKAAVRFMAIQPYGSKMLALHESVIENLEKLEEE
jgi:hypothetical protein